VPDRGTIAVVAARPRELAERWNPDRVRVQWVGEHGVGEPDAGVPTVDPGRSILLGDPDAWHGDWATLARARRDLAIVFHGCSVADIRAIARTREMPPLLAPGEVWLVENGRIRRAVLADGP
jgi:S-DNA-T family DNA segregation ATPase FtsK/SpoIIIE